MYNNQEKNQINAKTEEIRGKLPGRARVEFDFENNVLHVGKNENTSSSHGKGTLISFGREKVNPEDIKEDDVKNHYDSLDE